MMQILYDILTKQIKQKQKETESKVDSWCDLNAGISTKAMTTKLNPDSNVGGCMAED